MSGMLSLMYVQSLFQFGAKVGEMRGLLQGEKYLDMSFSARSGMQGKSRVSSAIKYDCLKLDDSGNRIIRKTGLHCI